MRQQRLTGRMEMTRDTHLHLEEAVLLQQLLLVGVVVGRLQGALMLYVASHRVRLRRPHARAPLGGEAGLGGLARSVLIEPHILAQAPHLRTASLHLRRIAKFLRSSVTSNALFYEWQYVLGTGKKRVGGFDFGSQNLAI